MPPLKAHCVSFPLRILWSGGRLGQGEGIQTHSECSHSVPAVIILPVSPTGGNIYVHLSCGKPHVCMSCPCLHKTHQVCTGGAARADTEKLHYVLNQISKPKYVCSDSFSRRDNVWNQLFQLEFNNFPTRSKAALKQLRQKLISY